MSQYQYNPQNQFSPQGPAMPQGAPMPGYPATTPGYHVAPRIPGTRAPLDLVAAIMGLVAFIFSFIGYYQFTFRSGFGYNQSFSFTAWHGFLGWFGCLMALFGGVAALAVYLPIVPWTMLKNARVAAAGMFGLGVLFIFISMFVAPNLTITVMGQKATLNELFRALGTANITGIGAIIALLAAVAGLVLALVSMRKAAQPAILHPYGGQPAQTWGVPSQAPYTTPPATPAPQQWPSAAPTAPQQTW